MIIYPVLSGEPDFSFDFLNGNIFFIAGDDFGILEEEDSGEILNLVVFRKMSFFVDIDGISRKLFFILIG